MHAEAALLGCFRYWILCQRYCYSHCTSVFPQRRESLSVPDHQNLSCHLRGAENTPFPRGVPAARGARNTRAMQAANTLPDINIVVTDGAETEECQCACTGRGEAFRRTQVSKQGS